MKFLCFEKEKIEFNVKNFSFEEWFDEEKTN